MQINKHSEIQIRKFILKRLLNIIYYMMIFIIVYVCIIGIFLFSKYW